MCHMHKRDKVVRSGPADAARTHTAVAVAVKDPAFFIDGDFIKIEKVAILCATPRLPDACQALNRVVRRRIDRRPGLTTIISRSDKCVPFAPETYRLIVTRDIGAEETYRGATGTAADGFDFRSVKNAVRATEVHI